MNETELRWWMNHYHDEWILIKNKLSQHCYMIINPNENKEKIKEKEMKI